MRNWSRSSLLTSLGAKLLLPKLLGGVGRSLGEPELNMFNVLYCFFDVFHIQYGGTLLDVRADSFPSSHRSTRAAGRGAWVAFALVQHGLILSSSVTVTAAMATTASTARSM